VVAKPNSCALGSVDVNMQGFHALDFASVVIYI
jgi:hypothetical protein